jgi:hypothetical protein
LGTLFLQLPGHRSSLGEERLEQIKLTAKRSARNDQLLMNFPNTVLELQEYLSMVQGRSSSS